MTRGLRVAVVGISDRQIDKIINDVFEREGPLRPLENTQYLPVCRIEQAKGRRVDQVIMLADKHGCLTPTQYAVMDILKCNLNCVVPEDFKIQILKY